MPLQENAVDLSFNPWDTAYDPFDILSPKGKKSGGSTILLSDTFTGVNGTALTSHAMDVGPGWTAVTGTFQIQSNTCQGNTDADGDITVSQAGQANTTASVISTAVYSSAGNAERPGLIFRFQDSTHYWLIDWAADSSLLTLYRVAGSFTSIGTSAQTVASGTAVTLKAVCSGNNITVFFNGTSVITTSDATYNTATQYGFRLGKPGTPPGKGSWDNFLVTTP